MVPLIDAVGTEFGGLQVTQIRKEVIQMIEELPDDAGIADIMAELYFRQKVDESQKEFDEGKGIPHEQVRERLLTNQSNHAGQRV
jgi:hypothetical protein